MTTGDVQNASLAEHCAELGRQLGRTVRERERTGALDPSDWKRCADGGVLGLLLPSEYGGGGFGPLAYAQAMEALGAGCLDNGLLMSIGAHVLAAEVPIWKFGDEHQRRAYLPSLASGAAIGCHAITEPGSGSDALALATTAERRGTTYRLTGVKRFATNAPIADVFIVYATIDTNLGFTGVTAFIVERGDQGVTVRDGDTKMGLRTTPWGDVELDGCVVDGSRRLGRDKEGRHILELTMAWERTLLLAPWLGVLRREIELCTRHGKQRRQFSRSINQFQSVSNRLVDMLMDLEMSRLLIHHAAERLTNGDTGVFAEMAKLHTSEAAVRILTSAMQLYGALGYTDARNIERCLRDAHGMTISSGTSDMQKVIIAGRLGITAAG